MTESSVRLPDSPPAGALARVAGAAARACPGVASLGGACWYWLLGRPRGIRVRYDAHGRPFVEITIVAQLDHNAFETGARVQDAVYAAVQNSFGRPAALVDVIIAGYHVPRGAKPKSKESHE